MLPITKAPSEDPKIEAAVPVLLIGGAATRDHRFCGCAVAKTNGLESIHMEFSLSGVMMLGEAPRGFGWRPS